MKFSSVLLVSAAVVVIVVATAFWFLSVDSGVAQTSNLQGAEQSKKTLYKAVDVKHDAKLSRHERHEMIKYELELEQQINSETVKTLSLKEQWDISSNLQKQFFPERHEAIFYQQNKRFKVLVGMQSLSSDSTFLQQDFSAIVDSLKYYFTQFELSDSSLTELERYDYALKFFSDNQLALSHDQKLLLIESFLSDKARENALRLESLQAVKQDQQRDYQQALKQYLQELEQLRIDEYSDKTDSQWQEIKAARLKAFKREYFSQ